MKLSLSVELSPTGIPYGRDDADSHDYVNLKENPLDLELLPELTRDETLKRWVKYLNEPDCAVETVGCEVWEAEDSPTHLRKGSYISVIFTDPSLGQNPSDWVSVFFKMTEIVHLIKAPAAPALHVECILKPFVMPAKTRAGWQLELWLNGSWSTLEDARKLWAGWLVVSVKALDQSVTDFVKASQSNPAAQ